MDSTPASAAAAAALRRRGRPPRSAPQLAAAARAPVRTRRRSSQADGLGPQHAAAAAAAAAAAPRARRSAARRDAAALSEERRRNHTLKEQLRRDVTRGLLRDLAAAVPATSFRDTNVAAAVRHFTNTSTVAGIPSPLLARARALWPLLRVVEIDTVPVRPPAASSARAAAVAAATPQQNDPAAVAQRIVVPYAVARGLIADAAGPGGSSTTLSPPQGSNSTPRTSYVDPTIHVSCASPADLPAVLDDSARDILATIGFDGKIQKAGTVQDERDSVFPKAVLLARVVDYIRLLEQQIYQLILVAEDSPQQQQQQQHQQPAPT